MPLRTTFFLIAAFCLATPSAARAQFAELSNKIPSGANTIVAMDVAALQKTPLAQQQGWTRKLEAQFVDRAVFLPPEADKLLIAGQIIHPEDLQQAWETAIITMTEPLSMRSIARAEGGYVDDINGKDAVWSPSGAYVVGLNERTLGIISPANRQSVGKWLDDVASNPGDTLTPYLQSALNKVAGETQIVLAIDLKNALSPHRVEDRLKGSETLQKSSLKLEDIVALVMSIQGTTVEVSIGSEARSKARVDFGKPVAMSDVIAKRLVLEALEQIGLEVNDLQEHKFSTVGNSVIAEGPLSATSLRRLLSVVEIPTTNFSQLAEETAEDHSPSAGDMAKNSQVYFKSVVSLLDDLRSDREKQDTRGGMDAVWMERYARKIDRLPILFVDEQLLDFGSNCAETLRVMATTRRGAGLTAGSMKSALRTTTGGAYGGGYYDYSYGYGGAGYVSGSSATSNAKDRNQIQTQVQNQATAKRTEGWRLIEDATADIRRQMTQKYSVAF
ncbi:MAG: hypothetical protein KF861_08265 [Planctomycetaceae bacterium]|nr:hypothetical protein [Planctomycetaceae bacterium]